MLGIHTSLAHFVPEFALDQSEAHEIATAYADVAQYYPALQLPPKYVALLTFCSVVGMTYGTRMVAWRLRETQDRQKTADTLNRVMEIRPEQRQTQQAPQRPLQNNGSGAVPPELRRGTIVPGVEIEFPADHELVKGRKAN